MENKELFGNSLKEARERIGWSIKQACERLNVPYTTWIGWESGEKVPPGYVQKGIMLQIKKAVSEIKESL